MAGATRRNVLAASVGAGALAATGLLGIGMTSSEPDLVRSIIERLVGPFRMRKPEFQAFVRDLRTQHGSASAIKMSAYRTLSNDGTQWASNLVPAKFDEDHERYERKVLTNFLIGTDYLYLTDPETEFATMIGDGPCQSPFARFDPVENAA